MIQTHSMIYYGQSIDESNNSLDFDEGAGELQATLAIGDYTLTEFADAIASKLTSTGAFIYVASVDRDTRIITISATGSFAILPITGSRAATTGWLMAGFTTDLLSDTSQVADTQCGSAFQTQFKLQDYLDTRDNSGAVDAVVNRAASGEIEVIRFGTQTFFQFNIKYATDITQSDSDCAIRTNNTGVEDLRSLMQYLITKSVVEFMPNEDDTSTFYKVLLESTADDTNGVSFKLNELFSNNLPGYYESGSLKLRVLG